MKNVENWIGLISNILTIIVSIVALSGVIALWKSETVSKVKQIVNKIHYEEIESKIPLVDTRTTREILMEEYKREGRKK